jgi:acetylornithine deacetylase
LTSFRPAILQSLIGDYQCLGKDISNTTSTTMDHPVVHLLKSLMSIVSTSELEHDIGILLEQRLQSLGYTVERIPIAPGSPRHNVYAYLGSSRSTRVLLTAHMDTVPPHIPLTIDGDIIRGRGSSDDLGPLAAQIIAAEDLRKEGKLRPEGDIGLLFVVGEENGGHGMIAANDMRLTWESGIFAEPTESKLAKGHKGQIAFEVIATGIAW